MNIKDKIISLRIKLLFWASLVGPSASVPFFGLYFRKVLENHTDVSALGFITLLLSLQPLLSILSNPIAGYIGDKFKIENRILLFCSLSVTIGGIILGIPAFFNNLVISINYKFILLCVGIIIIGLFVSPIIPVINTETIEYLHNKKNSTASYGEYRLHGTYSWILFTILIGFFLFLTNNILIIILFYCGGFLVLVIIASTGMKAKIKSIKIPFEKLKNDKPFRHFIIFTFIQAVGFYGSMLFTGYFFDDIHMNYFLIGLTFALSALLEVPAMLTARSIIIKIGNRATILISTIILMFKVFLLGIAAYAGSMSLIIFAMLLHGLGFGLQYNGIIYFIDKRADKDLRATYMNLYNMFGITIPMAFGALFCGWIIHVFNSTWMMIIESFVVVIGILYFIFFVKDE